LALVFVALTGQAEAAVLNFTGFETGDASECAVSGTTAFSTTTIRTGSYALRVNPTTTNVGSARVQGQLADGTFSAWDAATVYVRFYFRYATAPASNSEEIFVAQDQATGGKFFLRINSAGNLMAFASDGTTQSGSTGSSTLNAGTWYRIEAQVGTGLNANYEVRLNGNVELSGTNNLSFSNNGAVLFGKSVNRNGQTVDFFYDDIVVDDAAYPGPSEVKMLVPNAAGVFDTGADWRNNSGSSCSGTANSATFAEVDEVPHNSDTDFICKTSASSSPLGVTFNVQDTGTVGITGTVKTLKSLGIFKKTVSPAVAMRLRLRSSTTNDDTTAGDVSTSYVNRAKLYATDPATSAAWTLSGVDGVQVGAVHDQNSAREGRATALYVMVDYTPPTTITLQGTVYSDEGTTALNCDSGAGGTNRTVSVKVNGTGTNTQTMTANPCSYNISVNVMSGQALTVFLAGASEKAAAVTRASTANISDLHLYQDRLIVRHDDSGPITNTNLSVYDKDDDSTNLFFTSNLSGTYTLSVDANYELHVWTGDTLAPGGNVTTDDLHLKGAYSGGSETLELTGSGSGACSTGPGTMRPLCLDGGTFTASSNTVNYTGTAATTLEAATYYNLGVGTTANGTAVTYTLGGSTEVTRVLTVGNGGSTVNDTLAGSTYTLTLSGTTGQPFQLTSRGTFSRGTSTVVYTGNNPGGDTILAEGTAAAYHHLTVGGASAEVYRGQWDNIYVYGDLTVNANANFKYDMNWASTETHGDVTGAGTISCQRCDYTDFFVYCDKPVCAFGSTSGSNVWIFHYLHFRNTQGAPTTVRCAAGGTGLIQVIKGLLIGDSGTTSTVIVDNETNDRALEVFGEGSIGVLIGSLGVLQASSTASFTLRYGPWENNGTFTANEGTMTFDALAVGGKSLLGTMTGANGRFYNVVFSSSSGSWNFGANAAEVANDFTITNGAVTAPSTTLTIGRHYSNCAGAGCTFTHNSGTVTFNGSAAQSVTSGGDAFNTITVTNASAGGVTFADALTTANLTDTTAGSKLLFKELATHAISGTLTLTGASGNLITLDRSGGTGSDRFAFSVSAPQTVSFVSVANSEVSGSADITATDSTDAGNTDAGTGSPQWVFVGGGGPTPSQWEIQGGFELRGGSQLGQ
jgi:hypothetical protein